MLLLFTGKEEKSWIKKMQVLVLKKFQLILFYERVDGGSDLNRLVKIGKVAGIGDPL
jgi:hypothetical protein